jgi:hypothetical protein
MRPAISLAPETGTSRWQADDEIGNDELAHDISYVELLGCQRCDYERQDVAKPKPAQMAQVSWSTADVLRRASDTAFALEAYRRGLTLVGAKRILSGKHYESGKKKHRRKSKRGGAAAKQ